MTLSHICAHCSRVTGADELAVLQYVLQRWPRREVFNESDETHLLFIFKKESTSTPLKYRKSAA